MIFFKLQPWLLAFIFFLGSSRLRAEMRDFKDTAGRKVRAELVSHDGTGQISLKMENGTIFQKAANQFCADDQLIIGEWMKRTPATVIYRFHIGARAEKMSSQRKNLKNKTVRNEVWIYKVHIRNAARNVINGLKVEYRMFVQEEAKGASASNGRSGYYAGEALIAGPLRYDDEGSFTTREIPIDVVDYRYSTTDGDRHVDALRGLMLRIKDSNGNVVQEWSSSITTLRGKTWDNVPKSLEIK